LTSSTGSLTNPFRYTGREFDNERASISIELANAMRIRAG
jgi:hypothetical protein